MKCRICENQGQNRFYSAREMFFGVYDKFDYLLCDHCGCLQIAEYPKDISRFYPHDYSPFSRPRKFDKSLKRSLVAQRDKYTILNSGLLGRVLSLVKPGRAMQKFQALGLALESRILDAGCGSGHLLHYLKKLGFKNLTGIDFFIEKAYAEPGLIIHKTDLSGIDGTFDVIMLNHSLEHMPDQRLQLQHIKRLLAPGGQCMISLPVMSSVIWERYGVNWVQLDAPRHFYLHSQKSLKLVAESAQLKLEKTAYDSTSFQFTGSELYSKDISLSGRRQSVHQHFSREEIAQYDREADQLNRQESGDQATFYFRNLPR